MRRLTLISHAMTAATRAARFPADEPIEPIGERAAMHRAPELTLIDGTRRTRETARALGLEPTLDPALADLDVGRWRGLELSGVPAAELAAWLTEPGAAPHGGESVLDLLARVQQWLSLDRPCRTVAVTHPAVVRAVVLAVLHGDPAAFWRIDVPPLSRTSLHQRDGRWTLRTVSAPL